MIDEREIKDILDFYGYELKEIEGEYVTGAYHPWLDNRDEYEEYYQEWVRDDVDLSDWFYDRFLCENWFEPTEKRECVRDLERVTGREITLLLIPDLNKIVRYARERFDSHLEENRLTRADLRSSPALRDWYVNSWSECEKSKVIKPEWLSYLYDEDILRWFCQHKDHPLTKEVLTTIPLNQLENSNTDIDNFYPREEFLRMLASDSSVAMDLLEDSLIHVNGKYFFHKYYVV